MNAGDSASAVIGKSVQIRGEVRGSEDLMVDGHVEGTITLIESRLTIGPNAHVAANVSAKDVILLGQLSGNVTATGKVECATDAIWLVTSPLHDYQLRRARSFVARWNRFRATRQLGLDP